MMTTPKNIFSLSMDPPCEKDNPIVTATVTNVTIPNNKSAALVFVSSSPNKGTEASSYKLAFFSGMLQNCQNYEIFKKAYF
eukprot:m.39370 g.39370  ORF g.39370 m.39370 type:complete len:81 (-) comp9543_c0_seq1:172-414(-)